MKTKLFALASVIILVFMLINLRYPVVMTTPSSDVAPSNIPAAIHGCTSFNLNNAGHGVFGTNLDESFNEGYLYVNQRQVSKTGYEPNPAGEFAHWVSKYGSLTFNLVGYQMAWAGMNEAGLTVSTMWLPETRAPQADARPPLQSSFWVQYLLDNYSTIDEIIASDSLVRIAPGGARSHNLVCDSSGVCAVVEFLDGKTVYHTDGELPVAVLTNNLYAESVKDWQAGPMPDSPYDSLKRFGTAADRVKAFKAMSSESAVQYAFDTLTQVKNPDLTAWSIVFDAQNLRASFHTAKNEKIRYVDFNKLDFSCGRPVQALNIHADLSGDVSGDFVPYSHELSLAHTRKAFPVYGVFIPEEWIEKLLGQFESYPCVKAEEEPTQVTSPVIVDEQLPQATSPVKASQEPPQAAALVEAEKGVTKEPPGSVLFIGSLVAVPAAVLFLILYGIRRRK